MSLVYSQYAYYGQCIAQETDKDKEEVTMRKGFPQEEGHFVESLDLALKDFHVERETYFGGTFVGNHIHTTLKVITK